METVELLSNLPKLKRLSILFLRLWLYVVVYKNEIVRDAVLVFRLALLYYFHFPFSELLVRGNTIFFDHMKAALDLRAPQNPRSQC